MQAIRIHSYGGPEVVRVEDAPRPEPKGSEILVRVRAAAVNPVDWMIRRGGMGFLNLSLPVTLGCDLAGVVEHGSGAFRAGDEVYAFVPLTRNGAFAEFAIALENELAHKPKSLNFVEAASIPVAALTADQGIFGKGKLQSGQTILIHGGAGAVGTMAVQLAKWKGARVIATASGEGLQTLRELGADVIVDYKSERFEDKARDVDVVFDTVGGETQDRSFQAIRKGGILVSVKNAPSPEKAKERGITATMMAVEPSGIKLAEVAKLIDDGKLKTHVDRVFPLNEAPDALALSESGQAHGKLVLEIA